VKGILKNNCFTYECPTLDIQFYTTFIFGVFHLNHVIASTKNVVAQRHMDEYSHKSVPSGRME
jgi:hypothetical protein